MSTATPAPTPAWRQYAEETNARLAFDFPFAYVLFNQAGQPRLFTEAAELGELLGWTLVEVPRKGKPALKGYMTDTVECVILGARQRWRALDKSGRPILGEPPTMARVHDGQQSQRQLLVGLLRADGEPIAATITAKSTASGRVFEALTLCNKASTRARAKWGSSPPTFTWRMKLTAYTQHKINAAKQEWESREIQPSYADKIDNLDALAASDSVFEWAATLWRNLGKLWVESWADPEPEDGDEPESTREETRGQPGADIRAEAHAAAEARDAETLARIQAERQRRVQAVGALSEKAKAATGDEKKKLDRELAEEMAKLHAEGIL